MILTWNLNQQLNLTRETKNVKKFDDDVISENCDVIVIFQFLANLEQFGGWISDTESEKVLLSVKVTFCLTKTENRTNKSNTALTLLLWVKGLFWIKNANFLQKETDISKIKGA